MPRQRRSDGLLLTNPLQAVVATKRHQLGAVCPGRPILARGFAHTLRWTARGRACEAVTYMYVTPPQHGFVTR